MRRLTQIAAVFSCLVLATPALAGGSHQKPDADNPSGNDYTGWTTLYWIVSMRQDTDQITRITCWNGSKKTVENWAVQVFSNPPTNPPVADRDVSPLAPGAFGNVFSSGGFTGTVPEQGIGKILAVGEGGKKAQLVCRAQLEVNGVGSVLADLRLIPVNNKESKVKDQK